jgi:hypothetical protein
MHGNWSVAEGGVFFLDIEHSAPSTDTPLQWFSFATRKLVQVGVIRRPAQTTAPSLSVTSDGRWIAWSQLDHQDSNQMMIENFR